MATKRTVLVKIESRFRHVHGTIWLHIKLLSHVAWLRPSLSRDEAEGGFDIVFVDRDRMLFNNGIRHAASKTPFHVPFMWQQACHVAAGRVVDETNLVVREQVTIVCFHFG
jgi:hypothetical protein